MRPSSPPAGAGKANRVLLAAVSLEIGHEGRPLLAPMTFKIQTGEFWCLLGRNGAGKTTLSRTLLGLLPKVSGELELRVGLTRAYLPQRAQFDELYPMSAADVIEMGAERGLSFLKRPSVAARTRLRQLLDALDLKELAQRRYRDLSEGQKQRVLLARLALGEPELALLDEPTSAMDAASEQQAYGYLRQLCDERGASVLLVTHDLTLAERYADQGLFIDDVRRTVITGPPRELLQRPEFLSRYAVGGDT